MNNGSFMERFKVVRRRLITHFLQDLAFIAPWPFRSSLHRLRGVKIGKDVYIGSLVVLEDAYPEYIVIEDHVQVSAGAKIVTHDSSFQNVFEKRLPSYIEPVIIKRNAYIGSGALILPGVTVGENSIVGAGAVVTSNVPARSVVLGVPAKVVGTVDEKVANFLSRRGLFLWKYFETPHELTEQEKAKIKESLG